MCQRSATFTTSPFVMVSITMLVALSLLPHTAHALDKCASGDQFGCVLGQFPSSVINCLGDDTSSCDKTMFCDLPKWKLVKTCFDEKNCDGMFWGEKNCKQLVGICPDAATMEAALCPVAAPVTPVPGAVCEITRAQTDTILREMYTTTNGPKWTKNTNWLVGDYCNWHGITCGADGFSVTKIRMSFNGLDGPLPTNVAQLCHLTVLDLSENTLAGPIETFIPLKKLTQLVLGPKKLTSICVFPYQGPGMEDCLGFPDGGTMEGSYTPTRANALTGDFMATFTSLPELKVITLQGQTVYGKLDERFCKLTKLEYLQFIVVQNTTGYVPDCIGDDVPNLEVFLITHSYVGGTLPKSISKMQKLRQLGLSFNQLEGQIPDFPPNMMQLFVNDNKLSGTLPEAQPWVCDDDNGKYPNRKCNLMESFLAYTNNITGTLPASYSQMKNFKYLWISDNKISGTVPSSWSKLDNMLMVAMDRNELSGPVPEAFSTWFTQYTHDQVPPPYCPDCVLGSAIPAATFPIKMGLVILRLGNNKLSGTIPASLMNHPAIYDLELRENQVEGRIQDYITSSSWATNMVHINFKGNKIGGEFHASSICDWKKIDILELSGNQIGGSIPECIGQATTLRNIRMTSNSLTGSVPGGIGGLKNLLLMNLARNKLSGSIPPEVKNMTALRNWNSGFNSHTGTLYENMRNFGEIPSLTTVNLENNTIKGFMTLFILFEVGVDILWPTIKTWNLANNLIQGSIPFVFDQYVQEISYFNVEGNLMDGVIPEFPSLDVMLLARNPNMHTDGENPFPSFLRATNFMIRQDPTYSCPVISGSEREMVVSLDPNYYSFSLCNCEAGYFGKPPNCRPCLDGGICDGKSELMKIPAGWYPTPNATSPSHLIKCKTDSVATESSMCNPSEKYSFTCKDGYSGRLCAKCEDGYYQKGTRCIECYSIGASIAIIIVVIVCLCLLALGLKLLPKGRKEAVLVIKVLIVYMQFGGTFLNKTNLRWPASLMGLNSVFDITNVNLGFFSCAVGKNVVDLNTETEVWGSILFVCLAIAVLGFLIVFFELLNWIQSNEEVEEVDESNTQDDTNWDVDIAERLEEEEDNARLYFNYHRSIFETTDKTVKKMRPKFFVVRGVVTLLKFLYLPITTSVLQLFQCEEDPGLNKSFMVYNPPRECSFDDSTYARNIVFACILIPFYIIGFPVFIWLISVRYDNREKVARNVWFFLFSDFKPGHAMYIMWQLARQLILSIICVLIPKEANITLTLLVIHFFAMVMIHLYFEPYMAQNHNFNEGIAFTCLSLTLAFGLVNSQTDGAQTEFIASMLMLTQICFLLCVVYAFLIGAKIIPKSIAKKLPWYSFIMYHKNTTDEKNPDDISDTDSLSNSGSFAASPSSGGVGARGRGVLEIYGRGSKAELRDWLDNSHAVLAMAARSTYATTNESFDKATRETIEKVANLQRLFVDVEAQRKLERGGSNSPNSAGRTPANHTPAMTPSGGENSDSIQTNGHSSSKYETETVETVEMHEKQTTEAFKEAAPPTEDDV